MLFQGLFRVGFKQILPSLLTLLLGVTFIYLIMFIDQQLQICSNLALDYSTHTALALVFVTFLSFISSRALVISLLSMLMYIALMLYQNYHTLLDIVTTAFIVLPFLIFLNIKTQAVKILK